MRYDIDPGFTVGEAVVTCVSAFEGRDVGALEPLACVVDTDSLDDLFAPRADGTPRRGGRVSFVYSRSRVTVDSNEYVEITAVA